RGSDRGVTMNPGSFDGRRARTSEHRRRMPIFAALLLVLLAIVFLSVAGTAMAQVSVVGTPGTAVTTVGTATSVSITGYTTGVGTDLLLVVGVSWNCGSTGRSITGVTFTPDGGGTPIPLT